MTYVKILKSELDELLSLKDDYQSNCIKLYNDIQDRDTIIKSLQVECMKACKDKEDLINSLDEDIISAPDVSLKRVTVNTLMSDVVYANEDSIILAMKEKYL